MLPVNVSYKDEDAAIILGKALKEVLSIHDKILIVCIGTDKYICDCLGPLVGSLLVDMNIPLHVFGLLNDPIHSTNFEIITKKICNLYPNHKIIAIDGYLGNEDEIGHIKFKEGSIAPGSAISKKHSLIGNYAIEAIIENKEISNYLLEMPIRLRYIFQIAITIRNAFKYAFSTVDIPNKNLMLSRL